MVFVDQGRDLWIRAVAGKGSVVKLASMVDCAVWHDSVGMLSFIADHKLVSLHEVNTTCLFRSLVEVAHNRLAHQCIQAPPMDRDCCGSRDVILGMFLGSTYHMFGRGTAAAICMWSA